MISDPPFAAVGGRAAGGGVPVLAVLAVLAAVLAVLAAVLRCYLRRWRVGTGVACRLGSAGQRAGGPCEPGC